MFQEHQNQRQRFHFQSEYTPKYTSSKQLTGIKAPQVTSVISPRAKDSCKRRRVRTPPMNEQRFSSHWLILRLTACANGFCIKPLLTIHRNHLESYVNTFTTKRRLINHAEAKVKPSRHLYRKIYTHLTVEFMKSCLCFAYLSRN